MNTPERYDAIVIGAGQAGGPLATALARSGKRTALIEREHVGGTCINEGCTPTKTMVASARVAYLARRAARLRGRYRADQGGHGPRPRAQARHRRQLPRAAASAALTAAPGVDLICGEARFVGPRHGRGRTADRSRPTLVFINAGCRPAARRFEGLDRIPSLDSTSIMELDAGAGAPARAWRRLRRARVRARCSAASAAG